MPPARPLHHPFSPYKRQRAWLQQLLAVIAAAPNLFPCKCPQMTMEGGEKGKPVTVEQMKAVTATSQTDHCFHRAPRLLLQESAEAERVLAIPTYGGENKGRRGEQRVGPLGSKI